MPTNITPASSWDTVIPVGADGEGLTHAMLAAFCQPLANRTHWLYTLCTSTGVKRIREFADIATMKASTGAASGDIAYVPNKGLYRYLSTGVGPEAQPWSAEHAAGGVWYHELYAVQATNLATLSGGRVVQRPAYAMVNQTSASFGASPDTDYATTTSLSWTDTTALVSMTNVEIGDELTVDVHFSIAMSSSFIGRVRLAYEHNGTVTGLGETETRVDGTTIQHLALFARKVVASSFSAGTPHKFLLQLQSNGADTAKLKGMINFVMRQVRP